MKKKIVIICVLLTIAVVQLYCGVEEKNASASLKVTVIIPERNIDKDSTTSVDSHIPSSILPPSYSLKSPIEVVDFFKDDSGLALRIKNTSDSPDKISIKINVISKDGITCYNKVFYAIPVKEGKNLMLRFPSIADYSDCMLVLNLADGKGKSRNIGMPI